MHAFQCTLLHTTQNRIQVKIVLHSHCLQKTYNGGTGRENDSDKQRKVDI